MDGEAEFDCARSAGEDEAEDEAPLMAPPGGQEDSWALPVPPGVPALSSDTW